MTFDLHSVEKNNTNQIKKIELKSDYLYSDYCQTLIKTKLSCYISDKSIV